MAKKSSILWQLLVPVVLILFFLTSLIIGSVIRVFTSSYGSEVMAQNLSVAEYLSEAVGTFLDGAYSLTEEISANSDVRSMNGEAQHEVLASTAERNNYIETIYVQRLDGSQTGRSSGNLGNRKDRWWFKQLLKTQKPFVSNSYYSVATDMPCASVFFPITGYDGGIVGNVGVDIKLDYLQSLVSRRKGKGGERYSFIIDGEDGVVAHPDSRYIKEVYNFKKLTHTVSVKDASGNVLRDDKGNVLETQEPFEADPKMIDCVQSLLSGQSGTAQVRLDGGDCFLAYAPISVRGDSKSWGIVTAQSKSSAFALMHKIVFYMVLIGSVALVAAIAIVILLAHGLTSPIARVIPVLNEFAKNNFSKRIKPSKSNNEINDIITAFNDVSAKMEEASQKEKALRIRERDMGRRLFESAQNLVVTTKETAATSQDSSAAVKEIVATMEDTNMLSENISQKIKDVSSVAKITSSDVADGVAQIEENVSRLHEIYNANQQTIDGIKDLSEKIESIWDIVTLINNVADQAKIIAFNAELEASSAGEAGKSFRIVANEIRRLSDGIIDGTKEIKEKINEIQHSSDTLILASESGTEKINAGYENARGLGEKFESIKNSAEVTAGSAADISDIIQQQATASEQILIALKEISAGVENFTVATDNISNAAENVRQISEDLNNASSSDE